MRTYKILKSYWGPQAPMKRQWGGPSTLALLSPHPAGHVAFSLCPHSHLWGRVLVSYTGPESAMPQLPLRETCSRRGRQFLAQKGLWPAPRDPSTLTPGRVDQGWRFHPMASSLTSLSSRDKDKDIGWRLGSDLPWGIWTQDIQRQWVSRWQ